MPLDSVSGVGPVRLKIPVAALERYLVQNIPDMRPPMEVQQFEFGQSNPTYLLTTGLAGSDPGFGSTATVGKKQQRKHFVLRKKPPGRLLSASAHKIEREAQVLMLLGRHNDKMRSTNTVSNANSDRDSGSQHRSIPVPHVFTLCEDSTIIGTPFYVMEYMCGRKFEDASMPSLGFAPQQRTAMWRAATKTLARLHAVEWRHLDNWQTVFLPSVSSKPPVSTPALTSHGPQQLSGADMRNSKNSSSSFYARQLRTWRRICAAQAATRDSNTGNAVGELPHMTELMDFFDGRRDLWPQDRTTIVHGDYKIDNLIFDAETPTVVGILDWEMTTLGHPLSDLMNFTTPFFTCRAEAPPSSPLHRSQQWQGQERPGDVVHPAFLPGATPGLPTADTIYAWYAQEYTRLVPSSSLAASLPPLFTRRELNWGMAFNVFRLAAVCQGIAARVALGQASSAEAQRHAELRGPLARFAWRMVVEQVLDLPVSGEDRNGDGVMGKKNEKGGTAKL